jgi:hypothetical protein
MKSEVEIRKMYQEQIKFLKQCDRLPVRKWNAEREEAYHASIRVYETLHDILEIPGEPEWCS